MTRVSIGEEETVAILKQILKEIKDKKEKVIKKCCLSEKVSDQISSIFLCCIMG